MATQRSFPQPTYTDAQIQQFYTRISLPSKYRVSSLAASPFSAAPSSELELLTVLQHYSLAAIPFENLALHYSPHHSISLDPASLFEKIVARGAGRGGYCMENNCLLGTVLRSLGFDIYATGARVNEAIEPVSQGKNWEGEKFDGWNHMINIVTINGVKHVLDIGNGSTGAMHPTPLTADEISTNVGQQVLRFRETSIAQHSNASQRLWLYEVRHTPTSDWTPCYAFSELEFTSDDFEIMSFFTSNSRQSWFTYLLVCTKMLMEEDEIVGDIALFGTQVKRRVRGESEVLMVCESEEERVAALEKYFGVVLSEAERNGIRGMITQIL